jgi:hypothetical protein
MAVAHAERAYELEAECGISPDGQILAAAMGGVMLWRVTDNEFLHEPK